MPEPDVSARYSVLRNPSLHDLVTQARLTVALHPQIIRHLHANCVALIKQAEVSDACHRRNLIAHAQELLVKLEGSIKVTDEVSKGIFNIYEYCFCLLETDDPADYNLARSVISLLRDTFSFLLTCRPGIN